MHLKNLNPWIRLIRFHEYGPLALIACISGALLATNDLDVRLMQLLIYTASGSISAFVINDVADMYDDLVAGRLRNPLASGELGFKAVLTLFTLTSAISITSLVGLNICSYILALTTLVTSYLYSVGFRLKEVVPTDLIVHGLVPSLLVMTAYTAYSPIGLDVLILSSMVFTSSCIAELLQELRDLSRGGTASYLGIKRCKDLVLALTGITVVLYVLLTMSRHDLNYLIIYVPLAYVLLDPVIKFRRDYLGVEEVLSKLRFRALVISIAVVLTFIALKLPQLTVR